MEIADLLELAFSSGAKYDSEKLSEKLQTYAFTRGWPTEVAQSLSIINEEGTYTVSYPNEMKDKILDLEYGTLFTPPHAVIRDFLRDQIGEEDFNEGISRGFQELGVI